MSSSSIVASLYPYPAFVQHYPSNEVNVSVIDPQRPYASRCSQCDLLLLQLYTVHVALHWPHLVVENHVTHSIPRLCSHRPSLPHPTTSTLTHRHGRH